MTAMPSIDLETARPLTSAPVSAAGWQSLAWAIFIVLVAVIVRAPYLGDPAADYDEQLYSVIGQGWLAGEMPYRDMWDRKPPGLFALFAAMHWVGGPSPLAYQIPGLLCTIAAALMIYELAQKVGTRFGAVAVSVLFLLNIPLFILHLGQSETFLMPLLLGQLILMRKVWTSEDPRQVHLLLCAVMLLGGIGLQIKYSVLPFCVLFAGLAVWRLWQLQVGKGRLIANLVTYAALGLAPTALFVAYFASQGEFDTFFFANFISILERGPLDADRVWRFGVHIVVAAFPLVIFAGIGWAAAIDRQERIDWPLYHLAIGFAGAGAVALLMLGAAFVHYFGPLLPFLLLVAAPFFSFHRSHRLFAGVAVILALVCASFGEQMERTRSSRAAVPALVSAIQTHVPQDECLFVFDGPSVLYAQAQRCASTRLVFPDHLTSPRERFALDVDVVEETARVMAARPAAVVISDGHGGERFIPETAAIVTDALRKDYVLAESSFLYPRNIELYIRADLAPNDPPNTASVPCALNGGGICDLFTKFRETGVTLRGVSPDGAAVSSE